MVLTESFAGLVQRRIAADPEFATALLRDGIDTMRAGGVNSGNTILLHFRQQAGTAFRAVRGTT